jgi:hypothetical protein
VLGRGGGKATAYGKRRRKGRGGSQEGAAAKPPLTEKGGAREEAARGKGRVCQNEII